MSDSGSCLQCGDPLAGDYCSSCGQSANVGTLRVGQILSDVFGSILDLQLPILRTTKGLLTAPGKTAAAWVDGQRMRYTNPIKYCVIIGVITTILIRIQLANAPTIETDQGQGTYSFSSLAQEYIAFLLMLLALPFGAIAGGLSRLAKVQRSATEWYVLFLYCLGISLLLQLALSFVWRGSAIYTSFLPVIFLVWASAHFAKPASRSVLVCVLGVVLWAFSLSTLTSLLTTLLKE